MAVFYTARKTLQNYMNGGTVLLAATVLALICCNIPFTRGIYEALWSHEVILQIGDFNLFSHHGEPMSVMAFINDALMAVFFFTVGLEIKREILVGELSNVRNAMLPIIAAVGGMLVPVTIYWLMAHNTEYANGMAIPMATDIAFSLGVLSLLGKRVPIGLMVFLTTLAVADDIGGILVIALFYSTDISVNLLLVSAGLLVLLFLGGKAGIQSKLFYGFMGIGVWFCFLNAGIHPTIAGVLIAFCVPAKPLYAPATYIKSIRRNIMHFAMEDDEKLNKKSILNKDQMNWLKEIESSSDKVISPLQDMEDSLHPLVNYLIVPLFAFANAGIFFGDMEISQLFHGLFAVVCRIHDKAVFAEHFLAYFPVQLVVFRKQNFQAPEGVRLSRQGRFFRRGVFLFQRGAQGAFQVGHEHRLGAEGCHAGGFCLFLYARPVVGGENDDGRMVAKGAYLPRHFYAVHIRQAPVDDVGMERIAQFHGLPGAENSLFAGERPL